MKDSGSYANPINSSFQKFRTTRSSWVVPLSVPSFHLLASVGTRLATDFPWYGIVAAISAEAAFFAALP